MRKLIFFLLLLSLSMRSTFIQAQNSTTDSLRHLLATEKEDTSKAMLLGRLSTAYTYSKTDTALLLAQQGLSLARHAKFPKGEAYCLSRIGSAFNNSGDYPKALENYLKALKIYEGLNDLKNIGRTNTNIGLVYGNQGDQRQSLIYFYKSKQIDEAKHDDAALEVDELDIGDAYEKLEQLDSARLYTQRAYELADRLHDIADRGVALNNFGNIYSKMGQPAIAMAYYRQGIPDLAAENLDDAICESMLGMAALFKKAGKADSALYYAKLSIANGVKGGFMDMQLKAAVFLTDYYKNIHNNDSAFTYQQMVIATKDSLFSQEKTREFQNLNIDEIQRQQEIQDAKEKARTQLKFDALIGGLALFVIAASLLYRNNRQRRKANELLQKQKGEIDNKAKELCVQKDNVELLSEIGRKITSSLSVEKIIGTVYSNVNSLMDAEVFGIGIYNDELKRIDFPATYEKGEALPFYSNPIEDKNRFGPVCFTSGKEIIMGNLDKEYKNHIQEVATPHEGRQPTSIIFLPLIAKEKKLGVITVQSFGENAYSDYHLFMLRNIATYTAIAIENAESYETLNKTVSTLKSTQSQLIQSEKMASLGELTAGIAHEIQNPLNFVNNFSDVNTELLAEMKDEMDKGNIDDAKAIANDIIENEQKINHHGKRADAIVKGMLQHSRSGTGAKEPTDINALADEYLRLSYHGFRAKDKDFNTIIKTDFEDRIGTINIIPQDIGRVLLNLYNNAFYAVNEMKKLQPDGYEPTVSVSTNKIDNKISIKVKDNGNGIPQNIVDKIFQPFFTTKPTGQGTGLGLSLSYDIIKAQGGEIKVETREGEGTEFIIQLPQA